MYITTGVKKKDYGFFNTAGAHTLAVFCADFVAYTRRWGNLCGVFDAFFDFIFLVQGGAGED